MSGQWIVDNDFETFMKYMQNNCSIVQLEKEIQEITSRKKVNIKFIIDRYFNGNINLGVYILTRLNLTYTGSDAQEYEMIKKQYEQKLDEYLKRLEQIENKRAKAKEAETEEEADGKKDIDNERDSQDERFE